MGKYRFKLSDMMPNAWFYKLKDMRKIRSSTKKPNSRASKSSKPSSSPSVTQTSTTSKTVTNSLHQKNSSVYCRTSAGTTADSMTRFADPLYSSPRKNSRVSDARSSASPCRKSSHQTRVRNRRTTIYKQQTDSFCSADQPIYYSLSSSELASPESTSVPRNDHISKSVDFGVELVMFDELGSWSSSSVRSSCSCCCRVSSSTADIIIDLNHHHDQTHEESTFTTRFQKLTEFDAASELGLTPIHTKLPTEVINDTNDSSEHSSNGAIRKPAGKEPRPLVHNNKYVRELKSRRPSLSDSFAVVKSSEDPQKDFKDSMMEMILENNLKGFKDLENLLACYLSLNNKEYHPLIVNAFEQIWLDVFCST